MLACFSVNGSLNNCGELVVVRSLLNACYIQPSKEYGVQRTLDSPCDAFILEFSMDIKEIVYTFESGMLNIRELKKIQN